MIRIYHNARCGKSRCALQELEATAQPFELVEYLKTPLSVADVAQLLRQLGKRPLDIIRTKEPLFQEKFSGRQLSDDAWIEVLAEHPLLLERPIIVVGESAWIARDEEGLAAIRALAL